MMWIKWGGSRVTRYLPIQFSSSAFSLDNKQDETAAAQKTHHHRLLHHRLIRPRIYISVAERRQCRKIDHCSFSWKVYRSLLNILCLISSHMTVHFHCHKCIETTPNDPSSDSLTKEVIAHPENRIHPPPKQRIINRNITNHGD